LNYWQQYNRDEINEMHGVSVDLETENDVQDDSEEHIERKCCSGCSECLT